jgi:glutamate N-acetyltransferase/amino-acid N-acetyltransferase
MSLKEGVDGSFNRITVDGCMSTNDSVVIMANGLAGNDPVEIGSADAALFSDALTALCGRLAEAIVADGEGATKIIRIKVSGAENESVADSLAHTVANSNLVKTAFFGVDMNWGRILAALGAAGIDLTPELISISIGGNLIAAGGLETDFNREKVAEAMSQDDVEVGIMVGEGSGEAEVLTTDLSYDYVRINAEYHT